MILKCSGIVIKWKPYTIYKHNKNQNYLYFVGPKQKTRLSENRSQSLRTDKMEARIHRKIKNVDISLDRIAKTIFQKVCTLTSLGWHTLARNGPARIVKKTVVGATSPKRLQRAQLSPKFINAPQEIFITFNCFSAKEGRACARWTVQPWFPREGLAETDLQSHTTKKTSRAFDHD